MGDGDFPEDGPLVIALDRINDLELALFGVEPRGGSNELDNQLEASQLLARIAAIEGVTHFIPRLLTLELRFRLNMESAGFISPTHKRTEGRAPVWGSEFTSKDAALQGGIQQKPLLG